MHLNLNHSISKEDRTSLRNFVKFHALTQLKGGAMVPHWTSISHTNRYDYFNIKSSRVQEVREVFGFQKSLLCRRIVDRPEDAPFSTNQRKTQAVGPAPTSCMQTQTSFPLGLHMQVFAHSAKFAQTKRFLTSKHGNAAPSHV